MHPTIRKARDLLEHLDQQEIEHETWRAEHAAALEIARIDALCAAKPAAAIKTRRFEDGLIYKRNDAALMSQQTPQSTEMPAELQRAWNRWADERIRDAVELAASTVGEEVGKIERGLKADIDRQFAELFAAGAQLRVELEMLRAKKGKAKPNAGA